MWNDGGLRNQSIGPKTTNTRLIATPDDNYHTEGGKEKQMWEPEVYTLCYDVIIHIIHHDMSVSLRFTTSYHQRIYNLLEF